MADSSDPSSSPKPTPLEAPAKILLVDDQPANLLALRAILEGLGQQLIEAHSGEEALRCALENDFAVILMDILMPSLDGFETAKMIRARRNSRHTPIIFLTAYESDRFPVDRAYALGAVDYLVKPLVPVIVQAKVMVFVDLFEKTREVKRQAEQIQQMERQAFERQLAEENLRRQESEQRFARFMQHLPGLAWIKDAQGRYVYANEAAEKVFGKPRAELYGKTDAEIFPPEVAAQFRENDRGAMTGSSGQPIIETLRHSDGVLHHSLVSKFPIPGPTGNPLVGGIAIDITDRLNAEAELRRSEKQFRTLADSIPQLTWMTRADGYIVWYNQRWYDYTGTTPAQMEGWGWQAVHDPVELPRVLANWRAALAGGEEWQDTFPLRRHDGVMRWHLSRAVPIRDEQGRIVRWFGTNTDITDQREIEQAMRFLAEASATLAGLVDYESTLQKVARLAVPFFADWCSVDMLAPDGSLRRLAVAHVDPAKVKLAHELQRKFPPDPQAAHGVYHVLRTGHAEMMAEIPDALLAESVPDLDNLRILRALGLKSYLCVPLQIRGKTLGAISFVTAESGRRYDANALALAEDLAHRAAIAVENARLYQELREADRRKDEFLAMLAHELRNPLAPVSNALHIMKMPQANDSMIRQARDMAERQVHHLTRLVDDLLDMSRIMRGKVQLHREPVELQAILTRAVETVQPLLAAQGHELTLDLPHEPLLLHADAVRLTQVAGNLLNNAAKYTEKGGHIWLSAAAEGGEVVLRIRDNGVGIAADMLPRIFDLFVQVERSMERAQGGLGIGLTLVRSLVELHGGSVEAHSEGPGKGSEFVVRLPLFLPQPPREGETHATERQLDLPASRRRILVVDDNVDAADSLALMLRLQDHEVQVAHDGAAALALARQQPPDIGFLDLGMPVMDGYELARRLRRDLALKEVFLVALSGWGQEEDRKRSRAAGFDLHLTKPVDPRQLQGLLADLKSPAR